MTTEQDISDVSMFIDWNDFSTPPEVIPTSPVTSEYFTPRSPRSPRTPRLGATATSMNFLNNVDDLSGSFESMDVDETSEDANDNHVKNTQEKTSEPMSESRPILKQTYYCNPVSVRQEEFYGDVQKTVNMLAKTIEEMPMPEDKNDIEHDSNLIQAKLYDHQRYGLQWLTWRECIYPFGGILADEMGLGKTIMIIALISKSKADSLQRITADEDNWLGSDPQARNSIPTKCTLVVCPLGCMQQWKDEILSKGSYDLKVLTYYGKNRPKSAVQLDYYDIVLTTYTTVLNEVFNDDTQRRISPLRRLYWKRIVLDEAHNIRNPKTDTAKAIYLLKARHRWAVTGTPVHNRPEDFFSMVKFLKMEPFDSEKVWNYWIGMKHVKLADARDRLHILGKALLLRRTKVEVADAGGNIPNIPEKAVEIIELDLSEEEKRVYEYLKQIARSTFRKFLQEAKIRDGDLDLSFTELNPDQDYCLPQDIRFTHLFALLTRLRQCAVLPYLIHTMLDDEEVNEDVKFDATDDNQIISKINPVFDKTYVSSKFKRILKDLEELRNLALNEDRNMDKVIVVSSWTTVLDILHEHLNRRRFSCVFITGRESGKDRSDNMKKFNKYPNKYHICLISLAAGGVGLNLVGANQVYFVEPHWNPQMELQAQDRAHRFGQTKDVTVKRYIARDTVEDRILDIQGVKLDLANGLLNSANKRGRGGLNIRQLRQLFK